MSSIMCVARSAEYDVNKCAQFGDMAEQPCTAEQTTAAPADVPDLLATVDYLTAATGFHEFAEFTAEDIGTIDSGLNTPTLTPKP